MKKKIPAMCLALLFALLYCACSGSSGNKTPAQLLQKMQNALAKPRVHRPN